MTLSIDSDEEAALAAIIIAIFTGNIKNKKEGRRKNGLNLGLKGKIYMDSILNYFGNYVWRKKKLTKIIFAWHQ